MRILPLSRVRRSFAYALRPAAALPLALQLSLLLAPALAQPLAAQDTARVRAAAAPATGLPLATSRSVKFTTDEGTWMSLDVSPDGRTIVFDLLGDLYTLPMAGGAAVRITDGPALDGQPRFSPDGRSIVFVSDRSGTDNLWLIEPAGGAPRALTRGAGSQFISPEWTPDGRYVVTSRSQTGPLGSTYDLWMFHKDGGNGLRLTGGAAAAAPAAGGGGGGGAAPYDNFLGAAFGKDDRYVFAAAKRGGFGYNVQLPASSWQIVVYDRETGKTYTRTSAYGSAMRPVISPDGNTMVYATRHDTATALRVRDLTSGDERWLLPRVTRDDQESRYTRDLLPGAAFTPDGKQLVLSYDGKFFRADVATGAVTPIPFTAEVEQRMAPLVTFQYPLNDSTFSVKQIRSASASPDGRRLAFVALDRVWTMELPSGTPKRLTSGTVGEFSPAWSPDSRHVAFVTWSDSGGHVQRAPAAGGRVERLSRQSAYYDKLAYTPDGSRIVVTRGPRQPRIEEGAITEHRETLEEPAAAVSPLAGFELAWIPAAGGDATTIAPLTNNAMPHFARDASRVHVYDAADGLVSMRFDGTDRKAHLRVTGYTPPSAGPAPARPTQASDLQISPDGERAAAIVGNNVYLVTVPFTGGTTPSVSISNPGTASVPVRRVTRIAGDFLGWARNGASFHYSLGRSYFTYDLAAADAAVRDSAARADARRAPGAARDSAPSRTAADSASARRPTYEPQRLDVTITVPRDRPTGTVALRGARVVSMKGDEVIENGTVVVTDNRITAVGPAAQVQIPAGARVIDVAGKTIIPGWIDIHAHLRPNFGIHRAQVWEYLANLAYGVTTTRDPQTGTTDVLSYADLVETGEILGPRIFSTGPGVFSAEDIKSLDDAREIMKRYSEFYDTKTIKQYIAGERNVRQWVIMAAKEQGIMPTTEGALDFRMSLTEMLDGYPGHEHSYPISPLYKDVVQLGVASGMVYTPTLLVNYGGPWGENYWYQRSDIHADPKVMRWTPHAQVDVRALRRPQWFRDDQYVFKRQAEDAARLVNAGGRVGMGGHGQMQGLGVHWELWSIGSGGMKPHDVLRTGTIFGAEAIGFGRDLGSLEPGKLADLQVLDGNPLADLRNTNTIRYVMKNGRLYEGETLKEIWPRERNIPAPWWWATDPR